ncbi:hypothetical protein BO94DRAFT_527309 [Aspergillus sclerotioniger CBS 115572]|uniref:Hepatocellular carcinoma-associated antigen 59-domain-containing protein n=1 Tax=Aspergillus sclerotioniger CBS 115572 TaxID=1450535 RepID=A0A317V4G6_9EURO|nr:hypothetical protein BO94DRAFT_527309 [Aspergillus sclerotioniger CBS 115572]PWY69174.1 hypothetical protein BO94DRAFT_527309 [Aspergillus sclerotioniger CBS 115572]
MDPVIDPACLFRPGKRRKFQRRRPESTDEEPQLTTEGAARISESSTPSPWQESSGFISPSEVLRSRRLHRARKGGIEFSATAPSSAGNRQATVSTVAAEDLDSERMRAMCDRFTAHTGQTVDVDKHMMAYIESEMAKRHRRNMSAEVATVDTPQKPEPDTTTLSSTDLPQREPASLGKLHEIDLGHEAKLQNIARTEAATRRLAGDDDQILIAGQESSSKMDPGGGDHRPWRNQKRRTSEDIERDRLVEEVLRESKLDVYEGPEVEEGYDAGGGDGQAADDRVAEQFRRDFLDAIQSRRRVARTKNTKAAKPDAPRGPKLGGSRSARAAMREMQERSGRK